MVTKDRRHATYLAGCITAEGDAMAVVEVYSTMLCPYCYRAKKLLGQHGATFTEVDVACSPERRREMAKRSGGRTTVPQIFINGRHIGGCDELAALDRSGQLAPLLEEAP